MIFNRLASSFITRLILAGTAVHLMVGVFVHVYWMSTSNDRILSLYFDYEGVIVFLLLAAVQVYFTFAVYRQFSSDQVMASAWFYLLLGSICTFVGTIFNHLLAVNSALNPLLYFSFASEQSLRTLLGNVGTVIGGPINMVLMGAGLYVALRVYKKFGMLSKLKTFDLALIGGAMLYALIVIYGVVQAVRRDPAAVTAQHALTWPGDYLTALLLLEAVFLRRSAADMGWGYISKVWGCFVTGIFITSFCSLMNWLTAYSILTWTQTAFVWYLWYPAYAAFALAPAYQWEAMHTAQVRLSKQVEELGFSALT